MILNINKEKTWTSFDVVAKLRGIIKTKKVGHAGTLDPLAEGVLIVLTGKDTKKQNQLMQTKKEYLSEITFGATTATYDLEHLPVLSQTQKSIQEIEKELEQLLPNYLGEIEQTAPLYSAKKVKGKALYKIARSKSIEETKNIELPTKLVEIYDFEVLDIFEKEFETTEGLYTLPTMRCRIVCSSGTYVRSIAHDLGEDLKTGGVLTNLVRTKVGDYTVENSVKIQDFEKKWSMRGNNLVVK
jgi:tRNA pseudouridine55 synthase